MHYDIAIVGAGVAGANAAYHAARAGARVAVIEQHPLPRYKTCGGGVLPRAASLLPFAIQECAEQLCHTVDLHFHRTPLHLTLRRETPLIYMTMRERLDHRLLEAALAAGAESYAPCRVESVEQRGGKVRIHAEGNTLTADFLIACDGVASNCAKSAGWSGRLPLIPACEWEVTTYPEIQSFYQHRARLDFDTVPNGYGWVFPKGKHLSVGVGAFGSGRFSGQTVLNDYLKQLNIPVIGVEKHGYALPRHPRRDGFARGRVLLAGDAAGLLDPLTGEGISFALMSGQLAVRALAATGFDPARAGPAYERLLAERIVSEIRLADRLARLFYGHPRLARWLLHRYGPAFAAAMASLFLGERSYRQLLTRPANYLKLLHHGSIGSRYGVEIGP